MNQEIRDRLHKLHELTDSPLPSHDARPPELIPPYTDSVTGYICPGTSAAIPRSVHLARLNAAWTGCDYCEWRLDTEGLALRDARATARIQHVRRSGICRTEFGVRGQYINHLNRSVAGRLAEIFCCDLLRHSRPDQQFIDTIHSAEEEVAAGCSVTPPVLVAYDSRSSAPDLFVGVTSAIRESGIPVIDLGRSTTASLLEAIRSFPRAMGGLIVTGAGADPSFIGLDVFDRQGHSVPVVWKDHGIALQPADEVCMSRTNSEHGAGIMQPVTSADRTQKLPAMILMLPEDQTWTGLVAGGQRFNRQTVSGQTVTARSAGNLPAGRQQYRISRHSGEHTVIDFEQQYRRWLLRWYQSASRQSVLIRTKDGLLEERVYWLAEQTGFAAVCRSPADTTATAECSWMLTIDEDDSRFCVASGEGRELKFSQLATMINGQARSGFSHITAHADDAGQRFWLTDTGRPNSCQSTEEVRDSLAVLGLLLQLKR